MTNIPEKQRLPLLVAVAAAAVLILVGAVVILPGILSGPGPTPSPSASSRATASPDASTPEGATRAFFGAVTTARRTGDAAVVLPFTTGDDSSAFLTIDGFVRGQREAGKASVLTRNEIIDPAVETAGDVSTVTFTNRVEGYDIDLDTREALESPKALPDREVTVHLKRVDGVWLVESFEVAV